MGRQHEKTLHDFPYGYDDGNRHGAQAEGGGEVILLNKYFK